jgi:hypothetical protein
LFRTCEQNYPKARSPYRNEVLSFLDQLGGLMQPDDFVKSAVRATAQLCKQLGIGIKIGLGSDHAPRGKTSVDRLLSYCHSTASCQYVSGENIKNYGTRESFDNEDVEVWLQQWKPPVSMPRRPSPMAVSVLHYAFMHGWSGVAEMISVAAGKGNSANSLVKW